MSINETIIGSLALKEAKKLALGDLPDVGEFRGKFTLTEIEPVGGDKRWKFVNDETDPLRFFHRESGFEFRPAGDFITDLGTIPSIVQKYAPDSYVQLKEDDFPEAYIHHDAGCRTGFCWVRRDGEEEWHKMMVTPVMADVMLYWMLSAPSPTTGKEANRLTAQLVYRAVRAAHAVHGE